MSYVFPNCVSVVLYNGGRIRLHPDQQWPEDDPFVKERPEFFSSTPLVAAHSDGYEPVERATRAPGEKRQVRRGRGRKPADTVAEEGGSEKSSGDDE
jgi:hypothetical protein